jgi:hypothetical protein
MTSVLPISYHCPDFFWKRTQTGSDFEKRSLSQRPVHFIDSSTVDVGKSGFKP